MKGIKRYTLALVGGLVVALGSLPASADTLFGVYAGAGSWEQSYSGEVESGPTTADFEDDLGLKASQQVARLTMFRNFKDRHQLDLDVFDLSQNSSKVLENEIEWGDSVFPISAEVGTALDLRIYKVAYSYYLWREPNFRLGATGGLYIADIGLRMRWP